MPDSAPGRLTKNIGAIAKRKSCTPEEIKKAIHDVKNEPPPWRSNGENKNPDMLIDLESGRMYPELPNGAAGEYIGDIYQHLDELEMSKGRSSSNGHRDRGDRGRPRGHRPRDLGFRGLSINSARSFDLNAWELLLSSGTRIQLRGSFYLTQGPAASEESESLRAEHLRDLRGIEIVSSVAFFPEGLRIVFDTGVHLTMPSQETYWGDIELMRPESSLSETLMDYVWFGPDRFAPDGSDPDSENRGT